MGYTDLTDQFAYKDLILWRNLDAMAENDAALFTDRVGYRRPVLKWVSAAVISVENNTGTANQSRIVFPDGDDRSVTEDGGLSITTRNLNLGAYTADWTVTLQSGLRSGVFVTADKWYAVYAVKSQIDSLNWTMVMDTTLPLITNYSTLNGYYGTYGWVYLGMVRLHVPAFSIDFMKFSMVGNRTIFMNTILAASGITLVSDGAVATITYTTVNGTGNLQIPDHFTLVNFLARVSNASANNVIVKDSSGTRIYAQVDCNRIVYLPVEMPASEGMQMAASTGTISGSVHLVGWTDNVLGVGPNAII